MHHNALNPVPMHVGGVSLEGFSISGLATWMIVPEFSAMFDAGECPLPAVAMDHVFLTHIHGDHARCLLRHHQLRLMMRMSPATYYVPEHAVGTLRQIVTLEAEMEGVSLADVVFPNFRVLPEDSRQTFKKGLWVRAFPVSHRVPSQGFTVGRTVNKLRPEFAALTGQEIGALRKAGKVITDPFETAVFTFIGDCEGRSLTEQAHIWESKVLVIECTYIEPEDRAHAHEHGHTHLDEIVEVLSRTEAPACAAVVLKHFSMKYSPETIRERIAQRIPAAWADRVHILLPAA